MFYKTFYKTSGVASKRPYVCKMFIKLIVSILVCAGIFYFLILKAHLLDFRLLFLFTNNSKNQWE